MNRIEEIKNILSDTQAHISEVPGHYDLSFDGDLDIAARIMSEDEIEDDSLLSAVERGAEVWEVSNFAETEQVIGRDAAIKWMSDNIDFFLSNELDELEHDTALIANIEDEEIYITTVSAEVTSFGNVDGSAWDIVGFGSDAPTIEGADIYAETRRKNLQKMTVKEAHEKILGETIARAWNEHQVQNELSGIMTPAEIESEFSLAPGAVRQAIHQGYFRRHRKADARTILIRRVDAEKRWKKHT